MDFVQTMDLSQINEELMCEGGRGWAKIEQPENDGQRIGGLLRSPLFLLVQWWKNGIFLDREPISSGMNDL